MSRGNAPQIHGIPWEVGSGKWILSKGKCPKKSHTQSKENWISPVKIRSPLRDARKMAPGSKRPGDWDKSMVSFEFQDREEGVPKTKHKHTHKHTTHTHTTQHTTRNTQHTHTQHTHNTTHTHTHNTHTHTHTPGMDKAHFSPVGRWFVPVFVGFFHASQAMQDFVQPL